MTGSNHHKQNGEEQSDPPFVQTGPETTQTGFTTLCAFTPLGWGATLMSTINSEIMVSWLRRGSHSAFSDSPSNFRAVSPTPVFTRDVYWRAISQLQSQRTSNGGTLEHNLHYCMALRGLRCYCLYFCIFICSCQTCMSQPNIREMRALRI